ncbi:DUF2971 domain-containing protein [Burkholderia ambifaria]|uniref:DUF2971 domain-containing protein n=1 Tax=Burkholderia ambifaria TaxID=152480 RepID=UPI001ABA4588|nr:DUF2971 domain-containing protein [Burkholderia ambifaria]MBR8348372.1 DUF2971 domain-containing protein [Burkholderia ambifaria]
MSTKPPVGYIFSERDLELAAIEVWMDTRIYRIFPISRFIQLLTTKTLTLVKPKKWDDPFENALLSATFLVGEETASFAAKESVYGQCWTLHRETDAMWRIYSHGKDGVRVTTTPRKLLTALKKHVGRQADMRCFIGKVQYAKKSNLKGIFAGIDLMKPDGSGIAELLLYKRLEFSHEKEMRLIYSGDDNKCEADIFSFGINPNELFDRILFDPRMDRSLRSAYIDTLERLGCAVEVRRSTLYDPPENIHIRIPG